MKKIFMLLALFCPILVYAQDIPIQDYLAQVFEAVKAFGGMSWGLKIMTLSSLAVGSMKVSALRDLIWNKPWMSKTGLQFLAAPLLAMLAGLASLWMSGTPPTGAALGAYFLAGLGGNLLKDLLENIKKIPGLGDGVVKAIDAVEALMSMLGMGKRA